MSRRTQELLMTAMAIAIVVLIALNSSRFFVRFDLTESKAHSISQVSRDLFSEIPEQVTITYYLSPRLQERFAQPQEIIDLLEEYAATSRGAIVMDVVEPASDASQDIEILGVVPQQLQANDGGEQTFAMVYSGIVISYLDRYTTLPFVFTTATLEYDVTSGIRELVTEESKNVGFLVSRPGESLEANHTFLASRLTASYDVRSLETEEPIPDDIDVVVVIAGQLLSVEAVHQLERYIDRGGAALVGVDSVDVDIDAGLIPSAVGNPPVADLLGKKGILVGESFVLDESYNQIVIQEMRAGFTVQNILPYEHWVSALQQYTSSEHPVTSRFTGLDLYWPTTLEVAPGSEESVEIIVATTPQAWLMAAPYYTNPQERALFRINANATRNQYGIVAVETGQSGGRIMVVADSDFLSDRLIQATQSGANLAFAEASVQWLGNDEDLLEIRTRGQRDLRLGAIDDPLRKRATVVVAQLITIYLVPAGVILFGVVRFARRRRRSLHSGGSE